MLEYLLFIGGRIIVDAPTKYDGYFYVIGLDVKPHDIRKGPALDASGLIRLSRLFGGQK